MNDDPTTSYGGYDDVERMVRLPPHHRHQIALDQFVIQVAITGFREPFLGVIDTHKSREVGGQRHAQQAGAGAVREGVALRRDIRAPAGSTQHLVVRG